MGRSAEGRKNSNPKPRQNTTKRTIVCKVNSSPLRQNSHLFADDIFRCIFVNEKFCILIKISLIFVPKGLIDKNPALVEILAWHRIGDKPLSEPMLTRFTDAFMRNKGGGGGGGVNECIVQGTILWKRALIRLERATDILHFHLVILYLTGQGFIHILQKW